jgi:hypothetical protein
MKRLITALLAVAFINNISIAQKVEPEKVPDGVMATFKEKFPTATKVNWEMENKGDYEAEFTFKEEEVSAHFDSQGNWIETEVEIKIDQLPYAILTAIKTDFEYFKIEEASKIENPNDGICFEAEVKNGKEVFYLLYTPDGKLIRKTRPETKKD